LQGVVFVRLQLSCSKIEFPYYAAVSTKKDVCCYCAEDGVLPDPNLTRDFKVESCLNEGTEIVKRNPKKN
jgi:hypothetical protein